MFVRLTVRVYCEHLSICVCASFSFGFENGGMGYDCTSPWLSPIFALFRGNGLLVDRYADSLKMSTYLVAFAIGDLDYLETAARDIQVSILKIC